MKKRFKRKTPPFVMIRREALQSKDWKKLSNSAKLIYIQLKSHFLGWNNGEISFRYNESWFSHATTSKALKQLEENGWIKKTHYGGLFRRYSLFKLTGIFDELAIKQRKK